MSPRPGYAEGVQTFMPAIAAAILHGAPGPSAAQRGRVDLPRMIPARDGAALGRRRLVSTTLLLGAAAALVAGLLGALGTANPQDLGWDYRVAYLPGAEAVVNGASPYPDSLEGVDVRRLTPTRRSSRSCLLR